MNDQLEANKRIVRANKQKAKQGAGRRTSTSCPASECGSDSAWMRLIDVKPNVSRSARCVSGCTPGSDANVLAERKSCIAPPSPCSPSEGPSDILSGERRLLRWARRGRLTNRDMHGKSFPVRARRGRAAGREIRLLACVILLADRPAG